MKCLVLRCGGGLGGDSEVGGFHLGFHRGWN